MMSTDVFYEMPESSKLYENQYEVEKGHWPKKYNECVVVLTSNGGMSDFMLYTLGLRDPSYLSKPDTDYHIHNTQNCSKLELCSDNIIKE